MRRITRTLLAALLVAATHVEATELDAAHLAPLEYRNPGLVVDLGVGLWAWPLPIDHDGDGDLDLLVSCPDVPSNGVHFFENPGGDRRFPVFRPGVRVARGHSNVRVSTVDGRPVVLRPGRAYPDFSATFFEGGWPVDVELPLEGARVRANQWHLVDWDGDGLDDVVVGIGDWSDYGWDDAFDERGRWTNGPLHGRVYVARNTGTREEPRWSRAEALVAGDAPVDVFGMPSPCIADFDGDGDLDLVCGEFIDGFTYFENVGTRREPRLATGRPLRDAAGREIRMPLCMIVPTPVDWDGDGDVDLVVGQEDGRVALVEHTGRVVEGEPRFETPRFFRQEARHVKYGALVTPCSFDWDGDGDEDLVCGNTAGTICFIENLDGGDPPRWAAPVDLEAGGEPLLIRAGSNGSIQGPAEAKWGYTVLDVADWDRDGLPDLVVNSIRGEVLWYRNIGTRAAPRLARAAPVEVEWPGEPPRPAWNWWKPAGKGLVTQWRSSPVVEDIDGDGLEDLVMLDHQGYLALFRRAADGDSLILRPPERVFRSADGAVFDSKHRIIETVAPRSPLRLNAGRAGRSGRRKMTLADWDGDGRLDLLVNSVSIDVMRDTGGLIFERGTRLGERTLAGHTTCPTTVDWDRNGIPDLLIGAEDGLMYYLKNPRARKAAGRAASAAPAEKPFHRAELIFPLRREHNHAPGIVECPNGDLLVSWYRGSGERRADDVAVWGARLRRGESKWGDATVWADHPGFPDGNTALFIDRKQRLWLFWPIVIANTWESCLTMYRVSTDYQDEGPPRWTWQGIIPLAPRDFAEDMFRGLEERMKLGGESRKPEDVEGDRLEKFRELIRDKLSSRLGWQPRCKPTVLPSGRMLLPLYSDTYSVSIMAVSDDDGATWYPSKPLAGFGSIQPAVLRREDGTLLAYMRENGPLDRIRVSESTDDGLTWGPVGVSDLPNPGSGLDGLRLASGHWLLIYNDTLSGRRSLAVSLSNDEGRTWKWTRHLERHESGGYHYPAVTQGRDGTIHAVYSYFVEGGKSMKHAAFNEAWVRGGEGE